MKTAVAYTRVSGRMQTYGNSLNDQADAVNNYCRSHKTRLVKTYTDAGHSGNLETQNAMRALLTDASHGRFDTVIVKRLDRLSRNLYQSLWIEKELLTAGVTVRAVEQEIDGVPVELATAFRQIIQVFAELEKNMTVRKMADGKNSKFNSASGPVCGRIAFGYATTGPAGAKMLVEQPEEQEILHIIRALRRRGLAYNAIARILNGGSAPFRGSETLARPARTGIWNAQKIKNALNSNHSKGKITYRGKTKKIKQPSE